MSNTIRYLIFLPLITSFCTSKQTSTSDPGSISRVIMKYKSIAEIPTPRGFQRITMDKNSFGEWLRSVKLKEDPNVHLYNGKLKADQTVQFAVLDIPIGNKMKSIQFISELLMVLF